MKVISDNPELLEKIYSDMKQDNPDLIALRKKEEGAQDVLGTIVALDITWEKIVQYIEFLKAVHRYSPYLLKTMYVETKDGTKIPYLEYVDMSDDEKAKFFRNDIS